MTQKVDLKAEKKGLLKHWAALAAFAYRNFLEKGRGAVVVSEETLHRPEELLDGMKFFPLRKVRPWLAGQLSPETRRLIEDYFPEKSVVVLVVGANETLRPHLLNSLPTPLQTYHAARAANRGKNG